MKPVKACPHCEGGTDLPHQSDADGFHAVDREIKATLAHLRSLTKRKSKLLRLRIQHRQRIIAARRRAL